ncbi:Homogentisate 1,2-dioxygenase, partial [Pyrenochaeta sp. MPI-SDFR-AT-0127]
LGTTGNPQRKEGLSIWVFNVSEHMGHQTAFVSLNGETRIIPQTGLLNITTELGERMVLADEIALIPRGMRYHAKLVDGVICQGCIYELYEIHFHLPERGIVGTSGLVRPRDSQSPIKTITNNSGWTIISRLGYKSYSCKQDHTPFDVAGWHGTSYPCKYNLARFHHTGSVACDHLDPIVFTVLSAPVFGKEPDTAVVNFMVVGKHYDVAIDTLRLPCYHRNDKLEAMHRGNTSLTYTN